MPGRCAETRANVVDIDLTPTLKRLKDQICWHRVLHYLVTSHGAPRTDFNSESLEPLDSIHNMRRDSHRCRLERIAALVVCTDGYRPGTEVFSSEDGVKDRPDSVTQVSMWCFCGFVLPSVNPRPEGIQQLIHEVVTGADHRQD